MREVWYQLIKELVCCLHLAFRVMFWAQKVSATAAADKASIDDVDVVKKSEGSRWIKRRYETNDEGKIMETVRKIDLWQLSNGNIEKWENEINKRWRCSSAPHFMKISINEIFNCMPVFEVEGKTFLVYKFIFFTYFSLFLMNGKIALFSYHHPSCLSPAEALRIIISSLLIFLFLPCLYKECVGSLEDSFLSYCHHNMFQYYF